MHRRRRRWAALTGAAALSAALLVMGAPSFPPGSGPDPEGELVVTVPAQPRPAAPPEEVWPAGEWPSAPIGRSARTPAAPISPTPSEVAQGFVREYLGLADVSVRTGSPTGPGDVRFEVVRGEPDAALVTTVVVRQLRGSWTVTEATSPGLSVTVEAVAAGALTVHGQAPPGQWVEAIVRETGGNFLELARTRAQVGAEGVYALRLRTTPALQPGGAVIVTARERAQYSPVDAVAVVPVTLPAAAP